MDIALDETETGGRYFAVVDGHSSEMTFSKAGESMIIIDHTDVPDALRGQGVGVRLVERAVEDMRKAGKKIMPLCPFAAAQFRKHREWHDVLQGQ
ncbi:MAG: GNAT family N-acetyltransferase [Pseudomonadota bacterium]